MHSHKGSQSFDFLPGRRRVWFESEAPQNARFAAAPKWLNLNLLFFYKRVYEINFGDQNYYQIVTVIFKVKLLDILQFLLCLCRTDLQSQFGDRHAALMRHFDRTWYAAEITHFVFVSDFHFQGRTLWIASRSAFVRASAEATRWRPVWSVSVGQSQRAAVKLNILEKSTQIDFQKLQDFLSQTLLDVGKQIRLWSIPQ